MTKKATKKTVRHTVASRALCEIPESNRKLGKIIGVCYESVREYRNGTGTPRIAVAMKIEKTLGITVDSWTIAA